MKAKIIFCALAIAMLLCACQAEEQPESTYSPSPAPEQTATVEPPTPSQSESVPSKQLPSAPPVCEVEFTQTDSFPRPFEDELLLDEERGLLLSTEQALYDYDTMWLLLEENFPYLEVIKAEMGIDWRVVKAEYRLKLANHAIDGYVSQEDFVNTFIHCVGEFQSVGHLFLVDQQSILNSLRNFDGELFKRIVDLLDNPKTECFYAYLWQCSLDTGGSSGGAAKREVETVSIEDLHITTEKVKAGYVGDGIPYVRIASFGGWPETMHDMLADFFSDIANEEHLIIDIRGNSGGSNEWMVGIVPFLEPSTLEYNMYWGAKSGSLNLALNPSIIENHANLTRYADDSWQEDFPYIRLESLDGIDLHLKSTLTFEKDCTQKYFSGKIWVLIDKYCYSATDAFVCFCKETGFATLVGSPTGGNGKGAQPYFMTLPYSGLIVEYEPYLTFNSDGTCNGIRGTLPDIVPEEGKFALETCLQVIQDEK